MNKKGPIIIIEDDQDDQEIIDGNLVVQYEEAENVFREGLVNALCHRSYYDKGAVIMVEIYDDRVVISNPGGLISTITLQEFGEKSFSRNPLVYLSTSRAKILIAIHANERVTKPQLAVIIDQSKTTIDKHISVLRDLGLLSREGPDKTGR